MNYAATLVELGDGGEAVRQTDLAAGAYRQHLDSDDAARKLAECDQNAGLALMELGRHHEARVRWQRARDDYRDLGDDRKVADLDVDLGNLARRAGAPDEAERHYLLAERFYRDHDLTADLADCLLGRGGLRLDTGDPAGARDLFEQAANIYARHGQQDALARAHHNIGLSLAATPRYALAHLVPAWTTMRRITWGLPEVAARARWRARTERAAEAVLEAAERIPDPQLIAEVIEAQRANTLIPTATVTAGISSLTDAAEDLPAGEPPVVICGWDSLLDAVPQAIVAVEGSTGSRSTRPRTIVTSLMTAGRAKKVQTRHNLIGNSRNQKV